MLLKLSVLFVILWLGTLIHQQDKHKDKYKWYEAPISNFITHSKELQAGFVSLQLSLLFQGIHFKDISYQLPLFTVSSIGQLGVMLTKDQIRGIPHAIQAILTYICQLIQCVVVQSSLDNQLLLGVQITNILYLVFQGIIRDEIGDLERYQALGLIVWLGAQTVLI